MATRRAPSTKTVYMDQNNIDKYVSSRLASSFFILDTRNCNVARQQSSQNHWSFTVVTEHVTIGQSRWRPICCIEFSSPDEVYVTYHGFRAVKTSWGDQFTNRPRHLGQLEQRAVSEQLLAPDCNDCQNHLQEFFPADSVIIFTAQPVRRLHAWGFPWSVTEHFGNGNFSLRRLQTKRSVCANLRRVVCILYQLHEDTLMTLERLFVTLHITKSQLIGTSHYINVFSTVAKFWFSLLAKVSLELITCRRNRVTANFRKSIMFYPNYR